MTLNNIWWLGFSSGNLKRVKYPFIAITLRSTLALSRISSMGQVDLFKNYTYYTEPCAKKKLIRKKLFWNNDTKDVRMNIQWIRFFNLNI